MSPRAATGWALIAIGIALAIVFVPYPDFATWQGRDNLEWSGPLFIALGLVWLIGAAAFESFRPRPGPRYRGRRLLARRLRHWRRRSRLLRLARWLHRKFGRPNYAGPGDF